MSSTRDTKRGHIFYSPPSQPVSPTLNYLPFLSPSISSRNARQTKTWRPQLCKIPNCVSKSRRISKSISSWKTKTEIVQWREMPRDYVHPPLRISKSSKTFKTSTLLSLVIGIRISRCTLGRGEPLNVPQSPPHLPILQLLLRHLLLLARPETHIRIILRAAIRHAR